MKRMLLVAFALGLVATACTKKEESAQQAPVSETPAAAAPEMEKPAGDASAKPVEATSAPADEKKEAPAAPATTH